MLEVGVNSKYATANFMYSKNSFLCDPSTSVRSMGQFDMQLLTSRIKKVFSGIKTIHIRLLHGKEEDSKEEHAKWLRCLSDAGMMVGVDCALKKTVHKGRATVGFCRTVTFIVGVDKKSIPCFSMSATTLGTSIA